MKTDSWSLFTYPIMDIKAAEALLNRRAAEGWTLDRVYLGTFARFFPSDTRSAWCVDWSRPGYSERPDYLALCTDAGWTLIQKVGAFNLYKAPVGTPPIQTDGVEEAHRFRQEVLRANFKGWVFLLAMTLLLAALWLLVLDGSWQASLMAVLLTNIGLALLLSLPAILARWLLGTGRLLLRLRQWDRAAGGPLPAPGRRSAGAAAWLCLLCRLWGVAVVACFLLDAGLHMRLSTALGMLIGSLLGLSFHQRRRDREGRSRINSHINTVLNALVLSSVLFAAFLTPLTDCLMPAPVLENKTFVSGAQREDQDFRNRSGLHFTAGPLHTSASDEGSFGLRHQSWREETEEAFGTSYSVRRSWLGQPYLVPMDEGCLVDCYTARWEWLARLVQALLWEPWYPPLDGYTDVWLQEAGLGGGKTESLLLLRSGKTVVTVETHSGPIPLERIEHLLALLSSPQGG